MPVDVAPGTRSHVGPKNEVRAVVIGAWTRRGLLPGAATERMFPEQATTGG